jgi:hypothetical protein
MKLGKFIVAVSSYHPAVTLTALQVKACTMGSIGSELICWVVMLRWLTALAALGGWNTTVFVADGGAG